jgi:catechol 2,3-dioxygenase-like lactoylglutathione lyase family enzyme
MKYAGTMLTVKDMKRARQLYEGLLCCEVAMDLGDYVAYQNGVALMQEETWRSFTKKTPEDIVYGANNAELYFEEHEIESFYVRMLVFEVALVHELIEHSWGQRVVRFYDRDRHIIEVGEHMGDVARRFLNAGLTQEETATRMQVPIDMLEAFLKDA